MGENIHHLYLFVDKKYIFLTQALTISFSARPSLNKYRVYVSTVNAKLFRSAEYRQYSPF